MTGSPAARSRGSGSRVCDLNSVDLSPRREHVGSRPYAAGNLTHRDSPDEQGVRDERPVAAPWNGLRAHQHDRRVLGEPDTPIQASAERRRLHVVGIPAEAGIAPAAVRRVRPRVTQPAQTGQMGIPHSDVTQGTGEPVTIELRIVTRSWNGANVDDPIDIVGGEQTDELVDRPC